MPMNRLPIRALAVCAFVGLLAAVQAASARGDADDAVTAAAVAAEKEAKDWPQWRGPGRDGRSADTGLLDDWSAPPRLLWMAKGMGKGYGSVVVADGRVFTTGSTEGGSIVVAVDERDGTLLWTTPLKSERRHRDSHSTPAVDGDRVYVLVSGGAIACLNAANGSVLWKKDCGKEWQASPPGYGYCGSPLVDGDRVIFAPGGKEAMLVALDKMTGEEIWRAEVPGDGGVEYASPVISHGAGVKQYVQLFRRGVAGIRAEDGKFLWLYGKVANGTANIPTCIATGDYVFCSSGYGTGSALLKLSPEDGGGVKAEEVYFLRGNQLQNHHGGMVLVGEHVYLGNGHNAGFPTCVELATGKIVWGGKLRGPGDGSAAVVCADGNLIFRYQSGEVALIGATPEGYELKGTFRPEHVEDKSWSHPVVCHRRLFLREQDVLMCYDLAEK